MAEVSCSKHWPEISLVPVRELTRLWYRCRCQFLVFRPQNAVLGICNTKWKLMNAWEVYFLLVFINCGKNLPGVDTVRN